MIFTLERMHRGSSDFTTMALEVGDEGQLDSSGGLAGTCDFLCLEFR